MNRTDHLRFAPDILQRLGEELVSHPEQGIIELVRNAYDADATMCSIELIDASELGGIIRICDDGCGMDRTGIKDGWLILGHSNKSKGGLTSRFNRMSVGEKGLGRLAALRLGSKAHLSTRPIKQTGIEYNLELDWEAFAAAKTVESVKLDIVSSTTSKSHGTTIEIQNLLVRFSRSDVERLARSLVLLADPFEAQGTFHPRLLTKEFEGLSKYVNEGYLSDAEFHMTATLHSDGHAEVTVLGANQQEVYSTGQQGLDTRCYGAPPAKFELWIFILDRVTFSSRNSTITDVREWLKVVGGVHLYHRNLRVSPYGDPGNDWLDINLSRVRSPELRPSTNTSIGRMIVEDPKDLLLAKTDRSGFVENDPFKELKRFAKDALDWLSRERLKTRESLRQTERQELPTSIKKAKLSVDQAVNSLPEDARVAITSAVQQLERAREREKQSLRDELLLYRTLATVGTTTAVFAHDAEQPLTRIKKSAEEILHLTHAEEALFDRETTSDLANLILRAGQSLTTFAGLTRTLLSQDKRRNGRVNVNGVIADVFALFAPYLAQSGIQVTFQYTEQMSPAIYGSVAALEAVLSNLITNAAYALIYAKPKPLSCRINIRTEVFDQTVLISFEDNGLGIVDIPIDQIWLPGRSTKKRGTGLGLTIVKDAVIDLGGDIKVEPKGELGGARFAIYLPLLGGKK